MTCVFLMMECIYGRDGMDPGIPNEAISHGSSLSDTPFMAVERQQHLSLLMKNYQSPLENTHVVYHFSIVLLA